MLIIFCILQYGNEAAAVPLNQFFSFGLTNNDVELGDGDDVADTLVFPIPFFFYGESYNTLGVRSD